MKPRLLPCLLAVILLWAIFSFWVALQWNQHQQQQQPHDSSSLHDQRNSPDQEQEAFLIEPEDMSVASSSSSLPSPRFLLGIFSHDLYKMERDRRQAVRDTYLSFYKNHFMDDNNNNNKDRICVISDILMDKKWPHACQMAYTFVVGGGVNGTAPTELLTETSYLDMMITDSNDGAVALESDVLSLNIAENGEYGKSTTWFRYATLLAQELELDVDYVIKTDTDALIIPHRFFGWIQQQELLHNLTTRQQQTYIYGGVPMDKHTCGWPQHDHCVQLKTKLYMGGALYLLSMPLAQYVTSDACPRQTLFLPHEDMAMGNYVFSSNKNKNIIIFANPDAYLNTWKHPIKSPKRMWNTWRKFLTARKKRQRAKEHPPQNTTATTP